LRQWPEHIQGIGAVRQGHGVTRYDTAEGYPAARRSVVLKELRPSMAAALAEYLLNCGQSRRCAQHGMFESQHKPRAGYKAAMRGSGGKHEYFAAGEQPFLAGLLVPPYDAVTEEGTQVVRCDVLVPLILEGAKINTAGRSTKCEFLR